MGIYYSALKVLQNGFKVISTCVLFLKLPQGFFFFFFLNESGFGNQALFTMCGAGGLRLRLKLRMQQHFGSLAVRCLAFIFSPATALSFLPCTVP